MADLTPARKLIQVEESRFKFAVSESWAQKIGATINFISYYQHSEKKFDINGSYNNNPAAFPFLGVDGLAMFEFNAEIIDVFFGITFAGTAGNTEVDIKWAADGSTTFASIFSVRPVINAAAGNFARCRIGSAMPNTTAPVLSKSTFSAKDVLRCDLLDAPTGLVQNAGIIIHYRPI